LSPVALMGVKLCLTLKQEHRTKMVEYRVLRKLNAPKVLEETGDWKRFHNEIYRYLHFYNNIFQMVKWGRSTHQSVCVSFGPHGKTRFPLAGCSWNLILGYFSKICLKIQFTLKYHKNIGYFTRRPMYI